PRATLYPYTTLSRSLARTTVFHEQSNGPNLPPPNWVIPASFGDNCATERKLPNGSADFSDIGPDDRRRDGSNRYYQTLVNRDDADRKSTRLNSSHVK